MLSSTPALDVLRAKTATWGNTLGTLAGVGLGGLAGGLGGASHGLADALDQSQQPGFTHAFSADPEVEAINSHLHDMKLEFVAKQHALHDVPIGAGLGATVGGALGYLVTRPAPVAPAPQTVPWDPRLQQA